MKQGLQILLGLSWLAVVACASVPRDSTEDSPSAPEKDAVRSEPAETATEIAVREEIAKRKLRDEKEQTLREEEARCKGGDVSTCISLSETSEFELKKAQYLELACKGGSASSCKDAVRAKWKYKCEARQGADACLTFAAIEYSENFWTEPAVLPLVERSCNAGFKKACKTLPKLRASLQASEQVAQRKGKAWVGMSREEAIETFGRPDEVTTSNSWCETDSQGQCASSFTAVIFYWQGSNRHCKDHDSRYPIRCSLTFSPKNEALSQHNFDPEFLDLNSNWK